MRNNLQSLATFGCILVIVCLGMLSTIMPWLYTPAGRTFNGMQGFSDDYTGYVSFIKEGIDGRLWIVLRTLPLPQTPTLIHAMYLWVGYVGGFFKLSAPLSYHLTRFILGIIFVSFTYRLFLTLTARRDEALLGTLVAFSATSLSWFGRAFDPATVKTFSVFPFYVDASGRATGQPHYLLADILVISIVLSYLSRRYETTYMKFAAAALSFLLGIIHPAFGVIVGFFTAMAITGEIIKERKFRFTPIYWSALAGLIVGLAISYWSIHQYPFVSMLSFEGYVVSERINFALIWSEFLAFGPVLWLALVGFIWATRRHLAKKTTLVMYWLMSTLLLFFFLYPVFRAESVRFIQSLYFVPMAYGAMLFFVLLKRLFGRWIVTVGAAGLILGSIPAYASSLYQSTTSLTDYKNFSAWTFPVDKQLEAYRWLDKNTPINSTVLAAYEAANNILIYSHNFVIGNRIGWTKDEGHVMEVGMFDFFKGVLTPSEAQKYLHKYHIDYLYVGYQEKRMGDISSYTFIERVFDNGEATIYRVKSV